MASRLFNVRLDADRLRKARRLRGAGRNLADVVREAIDTEYTALAKPAARSDPAAIVAGIIDRFKDPEEVPVRSYDVHDARAARRAVVRSLTRRKR
ncbi:MAG TPA: hypothetical protein VFV78_02570 [Vicinamibacterales bacterium]|nr:hypothetical protein [Vicinamibacterales bacterium]